MRCRLFFPGLSPSTSTAPQPKIRGAEQKPFRKCKSSIELSCKFAHIIYVGHGIQHLSAVSLRFRTSHPTSCIHGTESALHPQHRLYQHVADGDLLDPTEAPQSVLEMSVARSAFRLMPALHLRRPLAFTIDAACKNPRGLRQPAITQRYFRERKYDDVSPALP